MKRCSNWMLAVLMTAGLVACDEDDGDGGGGPVIVVHNVSADFTSGSYSVVSLDDWSVTADIGAMHTDGKALCLGDRIFVNELFGADRVAVIEPDDPWGVLGRHSTGADSNPVDAVLRDADTLLVAVYGGDGLVELDLTSGTLTSTTVDLSAHDPAGSPPEVHAIAQVGDRYYVSLQRLDGWSVTEPGLVVVLDADTLEEVGTIDLPGSNPVGRFRVQGSDLYLALVGDSMTPGDGGIAVVHTSTDTAGWVVEGADIGGDPVFADCFEVVSSTRAYVGYGTDDGSSEGVRSFDPSTGTVGGNDVITTGAFALSGSALAPGGILVVGDRGMSTPGLRLIDTSTDTELPESPISTGDHLPYSFCIHR